jgi:carnitine O-octanoyltransferase
MERSKGSQGCDRHLLGLKLTALENSIEMPRLFQDPAYVKSGGGGNYVLSTSLCGYSSITGGCPPMIHDGYGTFYGIPNDRYYYHCHVYSSKINNGIAGFVLEF